MANNKVSVQVIDGLEPILDKKADDSTVVHKIGNENIKGEKTFNDKIFIKQNSLDIAVKPSQTIYGGTLNLLDKNGQGLSFVDSVIEDNNNFRTRLGTARTVNGKKHYPSLSVYCTDSGYEYALCPTPSSNAAGTEIVTAKWVNDKKYAVDSSVVHKTGTESIDGNKTFTSGVDIKRPLSGGATRYSIKDTNNKGMSSLDAYYVGNSVYARLLSENYTASKGAWLEIQNNDNGKAILNCSHIDTTSGFPNPSASANGSEIATTAWFNQKIQVVSIMPVNPDPNVFYFVIE